jgi:hypothetical protein
LPKCTRRAQAHAYVLVTPSRQSVAALASERAPLAVRWQQRARLPSAVAENRSVFSDRKRHGAQARPGHARPDANPNPRLRRTHSGSGGRIG